jgi:hypothetical protein
MVATMAERPKTSRVVLIFVLATVLAVVLLRQFGLVPFGFGQGGASTPSTKGADAGKSAPANSTVPTAPPVVQVPWQRPDPIGPLTRDPTQLDVSKVAPPDTQGPVEPAEPEFRVAGIIYSTEQPSSIIVDGHILHEGETIHGATVLKITAEWAMLRRGDKIWTIRAGRTNKEPE